VTSSHSTLIICPWCGNLWARLTGPDQTFWKHFYIPCIDDKRAAFAYGRDVAGSLLELDEGLLDHLPTELLKREFYLHLAQQEAS
jgi:hypothetical protein